MSNSGSSQPKRLYNDGPCFPKSPLAIEAEAAYRHWFARTAEGVPAWNQPNRSLFNQLMLARASVRSRAVVGDENGVCLFRPRHEIEASKARGRAQAVWIAIEGWEHFASAGFDVEVIRSIAMRGWNARVQRWSKALLRPDQIVVPPRPHENIDIETQDKLDAVRDSWNLAYDTLPRSADIRPRSLRRLLTRFPLLQPPVIHGLLRMGETMNVIAPPKVGKSWLASDMALAVATGRPWLDRFQTEAGDVLIIDNELHPTTTAHRIPMVMNARGIDPSVVADHLFVANLRGNLKDIRSLGQYFDHLYEDRFKLIVLDAFYRALPAETDENDNAAMAGIYNAIDRYAETLGSAFVLIHRTSKGNQSYKSITDVGAGAGSQARATDTHLVLRPHDEDGTIVLDAAVRSWPPIDPFCLRWNFPVWSPQVDLDPANLRNESRRRRTKVSNDQPTEPQWDAQQFAEAFVGDEPKPTALITPAAKAASRRIENQLGESGPLVRRLHAVHDRQSCRQETFVNAASAVLVHRILPSVQACHGLFNISYQGFPPLQAGCKIHSVPMNHIRINRSATEARRPAGQLPARPEGYECWLLLARRFNKFIGRLSPINNEDAEPVAEPETTKRF